MVSHEAALHAREPEPLEEPTFIEKPEFVEEPEFVQDIEAEYAAGDSGEDSGGMMNLFGDEPAPAEDDSEYEPDSEPEIDPDEEIPPYSVA